MFMLETWSVYFFSSPFSLLLIITFFFFPFRFIQVAKKREKKGVTHTTHIPRVLFFYLLFFNCLQDRCKPSKNASEHILKDTQVDSLI